MYKDTPFKVSFVLSMNVEETESLLLACGQDTYCFRNPEHFIYYYCQKRSDAPSWIHACELITRYKSDLEQDVYTANDASLGMTHILQNDIKKLFNTKLSDRAADDQLILYMHTHQNEFSGLSLTARDDFLRMSQYLAILYPVYNKIASSKDPVSGEITETIAEIPVTILPDGTPKLSELIRAMFSTGGWLPTTIGRYSFDEAGKGVRTASSIKRREAMSNIEYNRADINEDEDRPFLNSVQYFVDSYAHHVDAIDRVFRRPANPGNVERRDVILFTWFFIRRYPELLSDEEIYGVALDKLTALVYEDNRIDPCMDYLMEELYIINERKLDHEIYDEGADAIDYISLFNELLQHFGMKQMYMPNPWDRFITMSLFAEDPDFFTEAVLWNTVAEEDDSVKDILHDTSDTQKYSFGHLADREDASESIRLLEPDDASFPPTVINAKYPSAGSTDILPVSIMVNYPPAYPVIVNKDGTKKLLSASLYRIKTGEFITINKSSFVFGRRSIKPSDILQDYGFETGNKGISRCHAAILFCNSVFYLADASTRNETWLNGQRLLSSSLTNSIIDPVFAENAFPIKNNDKIRIGDEEFVFKINQE